MKWICLDCNWTGSVSELTHDGFDSCCPLCGSDDVTLDVVNDDEHNADYVRDGLQAVRGQL